MNLNELEQELRIIENKKKEIRASFKNVLNELLNKAIDNGSEPYGVRWVQYIPSFNDGEPCVFSLGELQFYCSKDFALSNNFCTYGDKNSDEPLYDDQYYTGFRWWEPPYEDQKIESLSQSLQKFINFWNSIDNSYFQDVFGTNVRITFAEGSFTIEDWDCGY